MNTCRQFQWQISSVCESWVKGETAGPHKEETSVSVRTLTFIWGQKQIVSCTLFWSLNSDKCTHQDLFGIIIHGLIINQHIRVSVNELFWITLKQGHRWWQVFYKATVRKSFAEKKQLIHKVVFFFQKASVVFKDYNNGWVSSFFSSFKHKRETVNLLENKPHLLACFLTAYILT